MAVLVVGTGAVLFRPVAVRRLYEGSPWGRLASTAVVAVVVASGGRWVQPEDPAASSLLEYHLRLFQ